MADQFYSKQTLIEQRKIIDWHINNIKRATIQQTNRIKLARIVIKDIFAIQDAISTVTTLAGHFGWNADDLPVFNDNRFFFELIDQQLYFKLETLKEVNVKALPDAILQDVLPNFVPVIDEILTYLPKN